MLKNEAGKLLLLALLVVPPSGHAQSEFEQGTAAFQNEQYLRALEAFLIAEQEGDDSPTLTYNLALTYYKLKRYEEAAETFQRLAREPQWRGLARFHLALVAEKQGSNAKALRLYGNVERDAQSAKLRKLAAGRLTKLEGEPRPAPSSADRFSAVFNVTTGIDDNAFGLQDDVQLRSSAGKDNYNEYFAWGQYYFNDNAAEGLRLHGFAYTRRYEDFDSVDIAAYSLGLSHHQQYQVWETELGLAAVTTELGGEDLTDQNRLVARFQRPVKSAWISFAYMPSYHDGGSRFSHLDGWQHKAEARWRLPRRTFSFDLRYRWESNDRDDLSAAGDFFSYSPTRHSFFAGVDWRVLSNWEISLSADYRISDYDGTNRLTDSDGVFKEKTRNADRLQLRLKTQWQISQYLRLAGQVEFTDNQENFDTYTYDKTETSLMLEYLL